MAGHGFRDAARSCVGHRDCVGGIALHRGKPVVDQLRGHLGAYQLPSGECRDPASVELIRAAVKLQVADLFAIVLNRQCIRRALRLFFK